MGMLDSRRSQPWSDQPSERQGSGMSLWNKPVEAPVLTPEAFVERAFLARRCGCGRPCLAVYLGGQPEKDSPEVIRAGTGRCRTTCRLSEVSWRNRVEGESFRVRQAERERKGIPGRGNNLCKSREAGECCPVHCGWSVQFQRCKDTGFFMQVFGRIDIIDHRFGGVNTLG